MNGFLFIFRRDYKTKERQSSQDELKKNLQHWEAWLDLLAEKNLLAQKHQGWDGEGRVMKQGESIANGPYAEIKESIGGMIVVKAENYDKAEEIAKGCPVFELGGTVEIRMSL